MIYFPDNTPEIIDAIRNEIGREVLFEYTTYSGCSICTLDPVTNTSTDSFCISCSGLYWIPIITQIPVSGVVIWGTADNLNYQVGGKLFEGDCTVQIKLTNYNKNLLENTNYFIVDGKRMYKDKVIYRGVPQLNRIIIVMREYEK